jgi:hypothetical protein
MSGPDLDGILADVMADFLAVDAGSASPDHSSPLDADILADFLALDRTTIAKAALPAPAVIDDAKAYRRPDLRAMCAEQCAADPDRLPWPDEWFAQTDSGQAQACRQLWGAVLLACVRDVLGLDDKMARQIGYVRGSVSDSFFHTRDFHTICACAGFDGVALAERLTDPARRPQIAEALLGAPKGGAAHKMNLCAGGGQ